MSEVNSTRQDLEKARAHLTGGKDHVTRGKRIVETADTSFKDLHSAKIAARDKAMGIAQTLLGVQNGLVDLLGVATQGQNAANKVASSHRMASDSFNEAHLNASVAGGFISHALGQKERPSHIEGAVTNGQAAEQVARGIQRDSAIFKDFFSRFIGEEEVLRKSLEKVTAALDILAAGMDAEAYQELLGEEEWSQENRNPQFVIEAAAGTIAALEVGIDNVNQQLENL